MVSPRLVKKRSQKIGLPPGSPIHIGERKVEKIRMELIEYNASQYTCKEIEDLQEVVPPSNHHKVQWLNINGVHQMSLLEEIGQKYSIHPLVLEDIANTDQRPKMENYGDIIYIVLRMLTYCKEKKQIVSEQVSLILGPNYVISFQEQIKGDVFNPIRDRLKNSKGFIRHLGADYLVYSLLDAVIDQYFAILEEFGDQIEKLEDALIQKISSAALKELHQYKREMIYLRKSVWPLRELIAGLERNGSKLITKETGIYLRDIHDHSIQVMDTVETFRDMLSGMLDLYLSSTSNRMNEVMKVLTIIATLFMPLTFIVGIYGMNFHHMPELNWRYGYPVIWMVMIFVAFGMLYYFKRKKWI